MTWSHPGAGTFAVTATPDVGPGVTCATSTHACVLTDVVAGQSYQVVATAQYSDGRTAASTPVPFQMAPATPSALTVDVDAGAGQYTATWSAPAGLVTGYVVSTRVDEGAWSDSSTTDTSFTGAAPAGSVVQVRVRSIAGDLLSAWSAVATATRALGSPVVTATHTLTTVTLSWPAVDGATTYRVDHRNPATGTWVEGTPSASRTAVVSGEHGQTVHARVTALNAATSSEATAVSHLVPVWHTLTPLNGWVNYGGQYASLGVTRNAESVVTLTGLIRDGTPGGVVAQLPVGYRPAHQLMFPVVFNGSATPGRVDVYSNGEVRLTLAPGTVGYVSLSGIHFVAAGSSLTWTPLSLQNGWYNYTSEHGGDYADAQVAVDSYGRAHWRGLIRTATKPNSGTTVTSLPTSARSPENMVAPILNTGSAVSGMPFRNSIVTSSTMAASYTSLQMMYHSTSSSASWSSPTLVNGWVRDRSDTPTLQYTKSADGLVTLRGRISGGAAGTVIAALPAGFVPAQTELMVAVSDDGYAMIDVQNDGGIRARSTGAGCPWTGSLSGRRADLGQHAVQQRPVAGPRCRNDAGDHGGVTWTFWEPGWC